MNALEFKKYCILHRNYQYVFIRPEEVLVNQEAEADVILSDTVQTVFVIASSSEVLAKFQAITAKTLNVKLETIDVISSASLNSILAATVQIAAEETEMISKVYNSKISFTDSTLISMLDKIIAIESGDSNITLSYIGDETKFNETVMFEEDGQVKCRNGLPFAISGEIIVDFINELWAKLSVLQSKNLATRLSVADANWIIQSLINLRLARNVTSTLESVSETSGKFNIIRWTSLDDFDNNSLNTLNSSNLESLNYIEIL